MPVCSNGFCFQMPFIYRSVQFGYLAGSAVINGCAFSTDRLAALLTWPFLPPSVGSHHRVAGLPLSLAREKAALDPFIICSVCTELVTQWSSQSYNRLKIGLELIELSQEKSGKPKHICTCQGIQTFMLLHVILGS